MNDTSLAERLYGAVAPAEPDKEDVEGVPVETPDVPAPESGNGRAGATDPAAVLFPEGGDVPDSFGPIVNPVLEPLAREARLNGDHAMAREIDDAMEGLGAVFNEYGVGRQHAADIMAAAGSFLGSQKPDDVILRERSDTEAALRRKYGDDYDRNIAAARRVVAGMGARVPSLVDALGRSGLGNSRKVVEAAVATARRMGYLP